MEFSLCRGGGAFMVRVDSGMELYEGPLPTDTKLTFKIDRTNHRATHGPCRPEHLPTKPLNAQNGLALHWSDLTPAQQDAEEKALAEARTRRDRTVRDRRAVTKTHDGEEFVESLNQIGNLRGRRRFSQDEDLAAALELSKNENYSRDLILKEKEDARQLREAIQISKDDKLFHIQEEEESLRTAMMESMNACKVAESDLILKEKEDARQLREAIQISKDDKLFHIQEEEESLRIVMMESMNACKVSENKKKVEDNELLMILALSQNDTVMYEDLSQDSYETMLREAVEESEQLEKDNFAKDDKENKQTMLREAVEESEQLEKDNFAKDDKENKQTMLREAVEESERLEKNNFAKDDKENKQKKRASNLRKRIWKKMRRRISYWWR